MINGLLCLVLGLIYKTKNGMGITNPKFLTFLGEELNCTIRGFFCGIELLIVVQHQSEAIQRMPLFPPVTNPFKNIQRLLRLTYPFTAGTSCSRQLSQYESNPIFLSPLRLELQGMIKEPFFLFVNPEGIKQLGQPEQAIRFEMAVIGKLMDLWP